jgi:hypothetical protein
MLMDLKTSVGIIDEISCSKCSAIYDVCYVFVIFCLFSHYSCVLYLIYNVNRPFARFLLDSKWSEQVNLQWDDDEVRFELDQHT